MEHAAGSAKIHDRRSTGGEVRGLAEGILPGAPVPVDRPLLEDEGAGQAADEVAPRRGEREMQDKGTNSSNYTDCGMVRAGRLAEVIRISQKRSRTWGQEG